MLSVPASEKHENPAMSCLEQILEPPNRLEIVHDNLIYVHRHFGNVQSNKRLPGAFQFLNIQKYVIHRAKTRAEEYESIATATVLKLLTHVFSG